MTRRGASRSVREQVRRLEARLNRLRASSFDSARRSYTALCAWDDVPFERSLSAGQHEDAFLFCSEACAAHRDQLFKVVRGPAPGSGPSDYEGHNGHPGLVPWDEEGADNLFTEGAGSWDLSESSRFNEPDFAEEWAMRRTHERKYSPTPKNGRG
jgi:hypothetical protein